jgi:sugar phosphate isomerase/epimerase
MAIFDTGYYKTMNSKYVSGVDPEYPELEETINPKKEENIGLSPSQLGIGTNPFVHPIQGVEARLRDGASKMEIAFFGQGKGNKERFTPESIDKREREEIQNLMRINNTKLSTHATVSVEGLAGLGREGFSDAEREVAIKEIEKAIDFASDASTGGAIVFHTGEWQRPISEQEFAKTKGGYLFKEFDTEEEKAGIMTVDKETGKTGGIKKDWTIYEPEFLTVETFAKGEGYKLNENGDYINNKGEIIFNYTGEKDSFGIKKYLDNDDNIVYEDEWVDDKGRFINPDFTDQKNTDRFFERIPKWDPEHTRFKVKDRKFADYEVEAKKLKERHNLDLKPEQLFVKSQVVNEALTHKGNSLYHGQRYEEYQFERNKIQEALTFYKAKGKNASEEQLNQVRQVFQNPEFDILPTKENKIKYLERRLKSVKDSMRHIHESSSSADAKAAEATKRINRIETIHDYGIEKTADSISRLAMKVYIKNQHKKYKGQEDLYLAPENFDPGKFGGHPEEMTEIVQKSRKRFVEKNINQFESKEQAEKAAANTIKSTIDIGHLNLWRKHFQRNQGENDDKYEKRFHKWALNEVDKMHKAGTLGHFHLADNFGYDDEHLTPGQGNAPIKEFVKMLKDKGYDDFIIESGSFNPVTALHDTWSYFGTPVYSSHPRGSFRDFRQQHFQYNSSPLYIAGAYAPSNEFKVWSEVPLH